MKFYVGSGMKNSKLVNYYAKILKEKGYEIYIITSRYLTNRGDFLGKQMRRIVF